MKNYIVKKTEKIASAIYLITEVIKDSDFLKWEIREEAIHLVSYSMTMNSTVPADRDCVYRTTVSSVEKLISLITIAQLSLVISRMNSSIMLDELKVLIDVLNKDNKETQNISGYILSNSFFTDDFVEVHSNGQNDNKNTSRANINNIYSTNLSKDSNKEIKKIRQENIINLLKKDSNLSIKDFSKVIKDCSEKTIQRELTDLMERGIVKKVGERRWSTYSLV